MSDGRIIPVIQLRWSDETEWKTIAGYDIKQTSEVQLEEQRRNWAVAKAKYNLKYDAHFRVFHTHAVGELAAKRIY